MCLSTVGQSREASQYAYLEATEQRQHSLELGTKFFIATFHDGALPNLKVQARETENIRLAHHIEENYLLQSELQPQRTERLQEWRHKMDHWLAKATDIAPSPLSSWIFMINVAGRRSCRLQTAVLISP